MKLSVCYYLLILIFLPLLLPAQYVCTPCNLSCDTIVFEQAGSCPHCGMALIPQTVADKAAVPSSILGRIQKEGNENSKVMKTVSYLSDVYGPRLMATSNYHKAIAWTKSTLENWGADEVTFHSFDRAHRGWELESFDVEMIAPTKSKLLAYPMAYTQATFGKVEGEVLYLNHWSNIFQHEGKLKGKIVLLGDTYRPVRSVEGSMSKRFTADQLQTAADNPDPNHLVIGYLGRRSINQAIRWSYNRREALKDFFLFAEKEGVIALVEASNFPYGMLHADGNNHFPSYIHQDDIRPIASFVFANEHFGRLKRLIDLGLQPKLRLHLDAEFTYKPEYNQNLLATIEGSDPNLKQESVIIGGHFDSWHAGTGAVDNGSGVAIMMEAFRILKALKLDMKRTVKLALWGGEEQIFAGSFGYVKDFIGNIEDGELKAEAQQISAYFNLDNGAGKIRGIYTMGNDKVIPVFKEMLTDFDGDNTLTLQYANQTDHELFDRLNIPAFQFIQDPLDYMSAIHHTNMDLYEYVNENDLKSSAILVAYLIYQIANKEQLLPRKNFNSPAPAQEGQTTIEIAGYPNAKQANIIGTFNNWNLFGTNLYKTANGWACKLDLPKGEYLYKFYIDGDFIADPTTPKNELLSDGKGHGGLTKLIIE